MTAKFEIKPENEMALGRPRTFDKDETLDQIVDIFWRHGFEASSMSTIVKLTGIEKPSLYSAFGSKEQLFQLAFERYWSKLLAVASTHLHNASARNGIAALLHALIDYQTQPGLPHGCLTVHGSLVGTTESTEIRSTLIKRRNHIKVAIKVRLEQAKADNELPAGTNTDSLADFFATVIQGLAVQATSEANPKALHTVADLAMQVWPTIHMTSE
jgi:AcrR family transcriptional regulator